MADIPTHSVVRVKTPNTVIVCNRLKINLIRTTVIPLRPNVIPLPQYLDPQENFFNFMATELPQARFVFRDQRTACTNVYLQILLRLLCSKSFKREKKQKSNSMLESLSHFFLSKGQQNFKFQ